MPRCPFCWQLSIRATDQRVPERTDDTTVQVLVTRNQFAPAFGNEPYQVTVPETTPVNSTIISVTATDRDLRVSDAATLSSSLCVLCGAATLSSSLCVLCGAATLSTFLCVLCGAATLSSSLCVLCGAATLSTSLCVLCGAATLSSSLCVLCGVSPARSCLPPVCYFFSSVLRTVVYKTYSPCLPISKSCCFMIVYPLSPGFLAAIIKAGIPGLVFPKMRIQHCDCKISFSQIGCPGLYTRPPPPPPPPSKLSLQDISHNERDTEV